MRIYDISLSLSSQVVTTPAVPAPAFLPYRSIAEGNIANAVMISICSHTGTHVDAPRHFLDGGPTLDDVSLSTFVGRARVVELAVSRHITPADLESANLPAGLQRVLFKTRNSQFWEEDRFRPDYCAITAGAAQWLVERGLRLVGIDYLSVDPPGSGSFPTHHILLKGGVTPLEGLDLRGVDPGDYTLICLPLRLSHGDGSPVRAILVAPPLPE
ncbi:MAG: cyclase family protein [Chloroflexota bacterium]|nr:cyclase family protein [Chloroflexota bacterium]